LILARTTGLKGTTAILSLFFLVIETYKLPRPVNLEVTNEGLNIIVSSKGPACPQKFQYLWDGFGRQLMDLNAVSCQDVRNLFDTGSRSPAVKKSRNTTLSFFRGFSVVSFPGNRQIPGSKQPSNRSASKSA
jgi:hypothetical protein